MALNIDGVHALARQHHPDLWFADGNIILSASTTGDLPASAVLFRVHKSILARHSQIFEDMLGISEESVHNVSEQCGESV